MSGPAYATREDVLAATDYGSVAHTKLDRLIFSKSRLIDETLHRHFYPLTEAVTYSVYGQSWHVADAAFWLNRDLQSVTTITVDDTAQVAGTDYTLLPYEGPPYNRIAVDSYWNVLTVITGVWGYSNDTTAAGALTAAIGDTTGLLFDVSDSSVVGIGDLLTVDAERVIVLAKTATDTTADLDGALTAAVNDQTVTVTDGSGFNVGETILTNSERMRITDVVGNDLTVERSYDGSTLAAHNTATDVYAYRRCTVERAATGSTATTHLDAATITKSVPPGVIKDWCIAEVVNGFEQESSGYSRTVGTADNLRPATGAGLKDIRYEAMRYIRTRTEAV